VDTLSIESRMVLPSLLAESGAKNVYMPPDAAVFDWLAPRLARRTGDPVDECRRCVEAGAIYPDAGAPYEQTHVVDLAHLEPLVALPHQPGRVTPLSHAAGAPVQHAFIGTCTNGRLEDLAAAAAVLRRPDGAVHRLAAGVRMVVVPASSEVLAAATAAGYIDTFVAAGATIGVPGCGPCMGNALLGIPGDGETVISTANRNFRGRMGNPAAQIYLASPPTVAASAVKGHIAGMEDLD
jgi:3-isopropylmalate/(R)-2-methylmalate dehydratase large subunit